MVNLLKICYNENSLTKKIFVGNISPKTTDLDLFELFSKMGKVSSAAVTKGINSQENAGYGYVQMLNTMDTDKAVKTLNNTIFLNNRIRVIVAHPIDQGRRPFINYKKRYGKRH